MHHRAAYTPAWDDLKLLLTVGRHESLRAAAAELGCSHATVSRRLAELNAALGVRLFRRDGRRFEPTEAGIELIETAARIEEQVDAATRRVAGRDLKLRGVVRVAMPLSLLRAIGHELATFRGAYPDLRLEFDTRLSLSDLTRREADLVVRMMEEPAPDLLGRKVGRFESVARIHRSLAPDGSVDWNTVPWVDWDAQHQSFDPPQWLASHVPNARVVANADTEVSLFDLACAAVGAAFVPHVLADRTDELVPLSPAPPIFSHPAWVLTHVDLEHNTKVRTVMTMLAAALGKVLRPLRPPRSRSS
ncbi:MAG: LysR family transcriptional regulator [Nannocystales bacterium]